MSRASSIPDLDDESGRSGTRAGHLVELFAAAGISEITETVLEVRREHASFEEWWAPYTDGVGPAGSYVAGLSPDHREALHELALASLPPAPFVLTSHAWAARGIA